MAKKVSSNEMKWSAIPLLIAIATVAIFFDLSLHRKRSYIRNFEEEEYGRDHPFTRPESVNNGLAVYSAGMGDPVLLLPYPHGHTTYPMVQTPVAQALTQIGRSVVSFDAPGASAQHENPWETWTR